MASPAEASAPWRTAADTDYYLAQQRIVRTAVDQAQAAWQQLDPADPVDSWAEQVQPQVVATIEQAQADAASLAPLYVAAALAAVGVLAAPVALIVAAAFAGLAANGLPLDALVDLAFRRYRRAVAAGVAPSEARAIGLARLLTYVSTETGDAGRLALHAGSVVEPEIAGFERMVTLPACGRCVILAGRLYRHSEGFLRHPRCDCTMRPVTREQWESGNPANTPRALFDAMTPAQQNKGFGVGDAAAIRAGVDLSRVVNARRKGSVYVAGGHEYTLDATIVRGMGRRLGESRKQPARRYQTGSVPRPTAAQLVNTARDTDELITQLRRFGYLR